MKRRYRAVSTRDLEVLEQMYYEDASTEEIAKRTGMSVPNVYRYIRLRIPVERRRSRGWKRPMTAPGSL